MTPSIAVAVVYPLVLHGKGTPVGMTEGPVPFIEMAIPASDERTDRGRALPPHVTDLVLGQRWHTSADTPGSVPRTEVLNRWSTRGLHLRWIEVLRFIDVDDAATLGDISGGRYPELYDGLGVLHLNVSGAGHSEVRRFVSRGAQKLHADARDLLDPYGLVRTETAERLMEVSELPYLVIAAVNNGAQRDAIEATDIIARQKDNARTATVDGWSLCVWPDACLISAERFTESRFRLANRDVWVAMSVMLDAVLIRFAQHNSLSMLARRAADGAVSENDQARRLHGAALRVRSRVWWPTVGSIPCVERLADLLADQWSLEQLANAVFADVDGLAQHAELVANERLNRLLLVLTVGALGIAAVSLLVQVTTSDEVAVGAATAGLAAVASLLVALIVRRTGTD